MGKLKRSDSSKAYFTSRKTGATLATNRKRNLTRHLVKHPTDKQAEVALEKGNFVHRRS